MAQEGHHKDSYYVDTFISGLKDELSQHLYNHNPATLQDARNLSMGQEYMLSVLDKRYKSNSFKYTTTYSSKAGGFKDQNSYNSKGPWKNISGESRRLTLTEINDK